MGLLNQLSTDYYKDGPFGTYQFTSLDDIINYFMVAYVGEDKLISKARRIDVAFHAQRALAELSFDTFKSPQDYVNYTKVSWVDSSGIKHPLYPTSNTSNPNSYYQNSDGEFTINPVITLTAGSNVITLDGDYSNLLIHGMRFISKNLKIQSYVHGITTTAGVTSVTLANYTGSNINNQTMTVDTTLTTISEQAQVKRYFSVGANRRRRPDENISTTLTANVVPGVDTTIFVADSTDIKVGMFINSSGFVNDNNVGNGNEAIKVIGVGTNTVELSHPASSTTIYPAVSGDTVTFLIDEEDSRTWSSYKSSSSSEENQDDYIDDTYWPASGKRYGLDPQHAQANGSFYVDRDTINFGSNIVGKTVVLDYISDNLGYDSEMKVHKFAEEAMYKWIMYAILSTRANIPEYQVQRFKKEKFAETRKAKLRLSNIKLEELTQILRGKSKQIKH